LPSRADRLQRSSLPEDTRVRSAPNPAPGECYGGPMPMPWTWGSRVTVGVIAGFLGLALVGCATLAPPSSSRGTHGGGVGSGPRSSPSVTHSRAPASPRSAPLPRSSSSPTGAPPAGATVTVELGNNGQTVDIAVGQELMLVLPNPSERDMSREMVQCSNSSVLQLLSGEQSLGATLAVLRVPFRALRTGTATVSATGLVPFAVQVDVIAT